MTLLTCDNLPYGFKWPTYGAPGLTALEVNRRTGCGQAGRNDGLGDC